IRLTRRPVECTAVLVVERVLGLVGIFSVILVLLPFARDITQRQSLGELVAGTRWLLAATTLVGVLILLQPGWFRGLLRLAPGGGRPHPPPARWVPRAASPRLGRARPPLRRQRDRFRDRVLEPPWPAAARALPRGGGSGHHHPHVLCQRDVARDRERACERGAARLGGDDRRDLHRALGFGRGRARAGL